MVQAIVFTHRTWKVSTRSWTRSMFGTEVVSLRNCVVARLFDPVLTLSTLTVLVISHDSTVRLHPRFALDDYEVTLTVHACRIAFPAYSSSTRESETRSTLTSSLTRVLTLVLLHSVCKELWVCADGKAEKFYGDGAFSASRCFTHQDLSLIHQNMPFQWKSTRKLSSVATRRCGRRRSRFFLPVVEISGFWMQLGRSKCSHGERSGMYCYC